MTSSNHSNVKFVNGFSAEPSMSTFLASPAASSQENKKPFYIEVELIQLKKIKTFIISNLTQHIKTHANAHGRNTKLLKAKMLREAEESKGLRTLERKPTAYYSRSTRRRKLQSSS
jgi:hypothetical protein